MYHKTSKLFLISLLIVLSANLFGFHTSKKMHRDLQRNLDLGNVQEGLKKYYNEYGIYPLSNDQGEIIACRGENTGYKKVDGKLTYSPGYPKALIDNLVPCKWGEDYLGDALDSNYPKYVSILPKDLISKYKYIYKSDGKSFSLYGRFEGKTQIEYDESVVDLKIKCGTKLCNFIKTD